MTNAKAYLTTQDVAQRYGVCLKKAQEIIRGCEYLNGGLLLGKGKVLPSELKYWEDNRGRAKKRDEDDIKEFLVLLKRLVGSRNENIKEDMEVSGQ